MKNMFKSPFIIKSLLKKNFSIFIKTQNTPNPHFLKFLPGKDILEEGETYEFSNINQALPSPLARKLFDIEGVTKVFYGKDYVSVGKKDLLDWSDIKPQVVDIMCDYFTKNLELFDNDKPDAEDTKILDTDTETIKLIKQIIEARIRPVVQEDGGDIKYITFDEPTGIVYIAMKGSCSGCPSSSVTLKQGIEKMMTHYIAEVFLLNAG
jgi:Fe-S cluster biogenesis protein NfuA